MDEKNNSIQTEGVGYFGRCIHKKTLLELQENDNDLENDEELKKKGIAQNTLKNNQEPFLLTFFGKKQAATVFCQRGMYKKRSCKDRIDQLISMETRRHSTNVQKVYSKSVDIAC